jgi:hypothetical protein
MPWCSCSTSPCPSLDAQLRGELRVEIKRLRVPGDQNVAIGTQLAFSLDVQRILLFAPDGARL